MLFSESTDRAAQSEGTKLEIKIVEPIIIRKKKQNNKTKQKDTEFHLYLVSFRQSFEHFLRFSKLVK
jgi:uncharacterized protein (UPF0335 family)